LLQNKHQRELPLEFNGSDIRFSEVLVEHFLADFTREGDIVFDPFAGFGTTVHVAESMNRIGFGVEVDRAKCEYAWSILNRPNNLIHGVVRRLVSFALPHFNFSLTSPPYMGNRVNGALCTQNPLAGNSEEGGDYQRYLQDLQEIYRQMADMMMPESHLAIEVSNLKHANGITTLAWDIAAAMSEIFRFEGEIVVGWQDGYGYGYDHSYCLIFKKP
jgi:hypothetical protein